MEANVPDRDELGRFVSWAKKKGGEALDSIKQGVGDAARTVSVKADEVADKLGAAPQARDFMETDAELEAAEPENKKHRFDMKVGRTSRPVGPAKKPSYKPWSMEPKRGW